MSLSLSTALRLKNSSLIDFKTKNDNVKAYYVPCNDIAKEAGMENVGNLVALGAYIATQNFITVSDIEKGIDAVVGKKRPEMLEVNKKALKMGFEFVKKQ